MAHTAAAHGLDLAHRVAASCARAAVLLAVPPLADLPHAARAEGQPLEPPVFCPPTCAAVRRRAPTPSQHRNGRRTFEPRAPSPPREQGEVPCCAARDGRLPALGATVHAARGVSRAARPDARGCGSGLSCPKGRCTSWWEVHLLVPHLPLALQPRRPVHSRARHGAEAEPATRYACTRLRALARAESRPPSLACSPSLP
jgi:hypothetical protein